MSYSLFQVAELNMPVIFHKLYFFNKVKLYVTPNFVRAFFRFVVQTREPVSFKKNLPHHLPIDHQRLLLSSLGMNLGMITNSCIFSKMLKSLDGCRTLDLAPAQQMYSQLRKFSNKIYGPVDLLFFFRAFILQNIIKKL